MYPSSHDNSHGWYSDASQPSWYAGSRGGVTDNWSDLSFSPSPEIVDYGRGRGDGWWKPGNLPLEGEPALVKEREPVDSLSIHPISDPDPDHDHDRPRCLVEDRHPEYLEIIRRLDSLQQSPSSPEEPTDCDCSWSEFLSEKWKDLLIISLVVFVLVVIVIWVLRRRHRSPRRDY